MERDLRYHRRKVTRLQNELNEQRETDPRAKEAQQVFAYWKHVFDKNDQTVFGPARQKAVLARLKEGKSVAYLKRAIDGCKNSVWHVENDKTDLELICRDEVKLDNFFSLATHVPQAPADTRPPIEKLVSALEEHNSIVQSSFDGMTAQCPAHEDRTASLSITEKEDGTVLVNCHAGCTTEDIVVVALGLRMADLFTEDAKQGDVKLKKHQAILPTDEELAGYHRRLMGHSKALGRLTELKGWSAKTIHDFRLGLDEEGRIVIPRDDNVVRWRPAPKDGERKYQAAAGRTRDLWPRPESIKGDLIFIVEGETDAITAHELGLPATSIPGVSFAQKVDEWADRFRTRNVVLCLDCDKQGRKASGTIIGGLQGVARGIKVCVVKPGREDGYDLSDLVAEVGADRARAIIAEQIK